MLRWVDPEVLLAALMAVCYAGSRRSDLDGCNYDSPGEAGGCFVSHAEGGVAKAGLPAAVTPVLDAQLVASESAGSGGSGACGTGAASKAASQRCASIGTPSLDSPAASKKALQGSKANRSDSLIVPCSRPN